MGKKSGCSMMKVRKGRLKEYSQGVRFRLCMVVVQEIFYSGLNLNQDKATKPQTVQIVRQGEVTPYWFKVNPLYFDTLLSDEERHADLSFTVAG